MSLTVEMDQNGRILIPTVFRKQYHWQKGVKLTLKISKNGDLIVSDKRTAIQSAIQKIRKNKPKIESTEEFLKFRKIDNDQ